ncbi:MAG: 50S ribosomal protein L11 methyltransferase [Xanthobacteraceae bacterium]|nr:MAG: 50S ribosomal protein L11 methyltransferase [Xanthobacteraceae bacterium]
MTSPSPPATCANLVLGDERAARRIADLLAESFDADSAAVAVFETAPGRWDLSVYFTQPPDEDAVRGVIALAAGEASAAAVRFSAVAEQDWIRTSLEGLPPVTAGRFVVHGAHDRARVAPNQLGIEIEAALAFGTGHHGTTLGCLVLLDRHLRAHRPFRVLDLGAGTGVLAMAAARTLRRKVLASDIDRRATLTARDNARLNGVGPLVECVCAPGFTAPALRARAPFDLVLANILALPLQRLAAPMARHLAPNAVVILSGLLPAHANGVIAAYRAQGLSLMRRIERDGWTSLMMRRGTPARSQPHAS